MQSLEDLIQRLREADRPLPLLFWQAVRRRIWYRREKRIYVYPADRIADLPRFETLRRNQVDDLRYYERTVAWQMSPEVYRREAADRLAKADHLYTLVQGTRLLHYAWLATVHDRGEDATVGQVFFPPHDSAALYDHFTHPRARGQGLFYQAMCQILHDVPLLTNAKQAYIYVYADNGPSRHVIEKIGFRYIGSLVQERRLLTVKRYPLAAGVEFPTAWL
jgi:RimJ/RimL family protein N-acetyltransferase